MHTPASLQRQVLSLSVPLCSARWVLQSRVHLSHVPTKHSHDPTKNRLDGALLSTWPTAPEVI